MNPLQDRSIPYTTSASALKRLVKQGYLIKFDSYEIEDPFFHSWIAETKEHKV